MTEIANYGYKGEVDKPKSRDEYHPTYPEVKNERKVEGPKVSPPEVPAYDCSANAG